MWSSGTWFSVGSVRLTVGLNDLNDLFQPKQSYNSTFQKKPRNRDAGSSCWIDTVTFLVKDWDAPVDLGEDPWKIATREEMFFKHRLHATDEFGQWTVNVTGILIEMLKAKSLQMIL